MRRKLVGGARVAHRERRLRPRPVLDTRGRASILAFQLVALHALGEGPESIPEEAKAVHAEVDRIASECPELFQ